MKPVEFVERIRESVIDSNIQIYRNLFQDTSKDDVRDPYWSNALSLFNSLSIQQREILFSIIRQVEVDTVSNIFGVLDGTSSLYDNQKEEFILSVDSGETIISGDLQDIFLEIENG
jgi:hypothetical protein